MAHRGEAAAEEFQAEIPSPPLEEYVFSAQRNSPMAWDLAPAFWSAAVLCRFGWDKPRRISKPSEKTKAAEDSRTPRRWRAFGRTSKWSCFEWRASPYSSSAILWLM